MTNLEEKYKELLERPLPEKGFVLPRAIEEMVHFIDIQEQSETEKDSKLAVFYRLMLTAQAHSKHL